MRYDFFCKKCNKEHEVSRPMSCSGQPYACPDCGDNTERIYSAVAPKEFVEYYHRGKRIGTRKQDKAYLRKNGRVLTQETNGWDAIKKMAKDGQRRTLLSQKGHF